MTDLAERAAILETVADSLGMRLASSSTIHSEASGDGLVTGHRVDLVSPDGATHSETVYLQDNPHHHPGEGVLRMRASSGEETDAWLYPNDPALPALRAAVFTDAAAVLLSRLGLEASGLRVEVAAYRPGKRAVVCMRTNHSTIFLKVVKPNVVEALRSRHDYWLSAGIPVPRVIAWAPDGLVALEALPGIEAIEIVPRLAVNNDFVDAVGRLTAAFARIPSEAPARASLVRRLDWYTRGLYTIAPTHRPGIAAVHSRIAARIAAASPPPALVTIHGDLHLAQLFVDPVSPHPVLGILDIDTAGIGDPADDAAALWAHLIVTAEYRVLAGDDAFAASARELAERFRARWPENDDAGFAERAAAIAATHLMGHALSGRVATDRLLELANWVLSHAA